MTLDSGDDFTGLPSDQSDVAVRLGQRGRRSTPCARERFGVSLGGGYDQSAYPISSAWDMQQFGGALSSGWQVAERLGLRLDARIAYARLDSDPYLLSGGLRPSLIVRAPDRAPAGCAPSATPTGTRTTSEPFTTALERDGFAFGRRPRARGARSRPAQRHVLVVRELAALRLRWRRATSCSASTAPTTATAIGGGARVSVALPWRFSADLGASYLREVYANVNLIDALTDDGVGTATPSKRRDGVWETRLRIVRPLTRFIDVELSAGYLDRTLERRRLQLRPLGLGPGGSRTHAVKHHGVSRGEEP